MVSAAIEELDLVEVSLLDDRIDLTEELLRFLVERSAIVHAISVCRLLHGELA